METRQCWAICKRQWSYQVIFRFMTLFFQSLILSDYDPSRDCGVLDEDPLLDDLEEIQKEGNNIFEYHGADLFPERWFKLVVVLNTGFYCLYSDPLIKKCLIINK